MRRQVDEMVRRQELSLQPEACEGGGDGAEAELALRVRHALRLVSVTSVVSALYVVGRHRVRLHEEAFDQWLPSVHVVSELLYDFLDEQVRRGDARNIVGGESEHREGVPAKRDELLLEVVKLELGEALEEGLLALEVARHA